MKKVRKLLAGVLALVMILCMIPATVVASSEQSHKDLAREAVGEGLILLKNEDVLPLDSSNTVALFGGGQVYTASTSNGYQIGGGGSGWVSMKSGYKPLGPADALIEAAEAGEINVYTALTDAYKANVNYVPDAAMYDAAAEAADTAIMFITRFSTEGSDISVSQWYLSDAEKTMMKELSARFDDVIVLVNAPSVISTDWSVEGNTEGIDIEALMITYMGGEMGAYGMADVLLGKVNPSGKLVDTYAYDIYDYSTTNTFLESQDYVRYTEDIYVGYRYFETFAKDKVVYPFGFGLSYTSFDIKTGEVSNDGETITVPVTVTNTGDVAGKEVVQVYYSAPQAGEGAAVLSKSAIDLAAFAKTELLQPGKSQTLEVSFAIDDMASFDDNGLSGHESCYVLEAGDYDILVGNSVRNTAVAGTYTVDELVVTEELSELCATNLDVRLTADGTYETLNSSGAEETAIKISASDVTVMEAEDYSSVTGSIASESYNAESGWLTDGSKWYNVPTGAIVGQFQKNPNEYITYELNVEKAGTYDLGFVASNGGSQLKDALNIFEIEISTNDGETWTKAEGFMFDSPNTRGAQTQTGYYWWNFMYLTEDLDGNNYQVALPAGDILLRIAITNNVASGYSNTNLDKIIFIPENVDFDIADAFALYGITIATNPVIAISATEATWFAAENYTALGGIAFTEAFTSGKGFLNVGDGYVPINAGVVVGNFSNEPDCYVDYTLDVKAAGTYDLGVILGNGDGSKLNGTYPDIEDVMDVLISTDGGETWTAAKNKLDVYHTREAGTGQYYWNMYYSNCDFDGNKYQLELPEGRVMLRFANNENTLVYGSVNFDNFVIMPEGTEITLDDVIDFYGVRDIIEYAKIDLDADNYVGIKYEDVEAGNATIDEFVAQMSYNEMIDLCYGHSKGVRSGQGTIGFTSNATAEKYSVYSADTVDGPAGVDTGVYFSTYWPCSTLQACTWNVELVEKIGVLVGQEALVSNCDIWLAPGMNIHRSPLCGRNFEYYSEDPVVAGKFAAALTNGVQSQGVAVAVKHFAVNDKETNRKKSDSRLSEKALREIYLKGFEIVVEEANPITIMSSYNLINGNWASTNSELLEGIVRGEWGWEGLIMTDWNTTPLITDEINAGNNTTMPSGEPEQLRASVLNGTLSREKLESNTKYIVNALAKMPDYTINRLKKHDVSADGTTSIYFTDYSRKSFQTYFERVSGDQQCTSYINTTDANGKYGYHEFTVNAEKSGYYQLGVEYARSGGQVNNAFEIYVNGSRVENITNNAPGTGGWTTFKTLDAGYVYLNAGENVIRHQHISSTGLNYLTIKLTATDIAQCVDIADGEGVYGDTVSLDVTNNYEGLSSFRGTVRSKLAFKSVSSDYDYEFNPENNTLVVWTDEEGGFAKGDVLFTLDFAIDGYAAGGLVNGEYAVDIIDINATDEDGEDFAVFAANTGYITVATEYAKGDLNLDGNLTNADVITLARYLVNLVELDDEQLALADVNGDGTISNADLVVLVRRIVG